MNHKNHKNENTEETDKAWAYLYDRLERDGLIVEHKRNKRKYISPTYRLAGIAASIIVAVILVTKFFDVAPEEKMLALNNYDSAYNLVSTLEDGSVVYLSGHTVLEYPEHFGDDRREVFLKGNAYFDIAANPDKPFIVDTKEARIKVLGTAFNVIGDYEKSDFSLSVQKGEVLVISKKDNRSIKVGKDETVVLGFDKFEKTSTGETVRFGDYTEKIRFKDETLADVADVLNKSDDDLKIKVSPEIGGKSLTVTFSDEPVSKKAELICLALNLNLTRQGNTLLISE